VHWYCRVYDDEGEWTAYCVVAPTEYRAIKWLGEHILDVEGYTADSIDAEPWNTFEHGDINDYEIIE
jgi:hypothetical protein